MDFFMSWGPGLTALLGAGALFWTIGNSVRKDSKAEVADLRDSTDRKISALADSIADLRAENSKANADLRDSIADLREITAKNSADIANLRESIARTEMIVGKNADKIDAFIAALAKQH